MTGGAAWEPGEGAADFTSHGAHVGRTGRDESRTMVPEDVDGPLAAGDLLGFGSSQRPRLSLTVLIV